MPQEEESFYAVRDRTDPASHRAFLDRVDSDTAALPSPVGNKLTVQADAERFFADAALSLDRILRELLKELEPDGAKAVGVVPHKTGTESSND